MLTALLLESSRTVDTHTTTTSKIIETIKKMTFLFKAEPSYMSIWVEIWNV